MEKQKSFDTQRELRNPEILERFIDNYTQYERSKENIEIEIIQDADDRTSKVFEIYGLDPTSVPVQSVHIIDKSKWPGEPAAFMLREHGVFVCESNDIDILKMRIIHEMFHAKGINFLPIPLTEAIVERLTNQALNLDDKSLEGSAVFSGIYTYNNHRIVFDDLLKSIIKKAPTGVTNDYHSFSFFAKAHLSGRIHYLDFLDDLFGSGTLKKIDQLDNTPESFSSFVASLR